ncbi:MAG: AAA family ATPase, partial [Thermodesulfobacteriota bacterium]
MTLPAHIEALLKPEAYLERPGSIELIQTHISYIILTPRFVYKIKKPVNFGFLDFTTLEKRKHFCEAEIRLNQRLTEGIYLEVVPIVETIEGGFRIFASEMEAVVAGHTAKPIDYAVMMTRFDENSTLKALILKDRADAELIKRIARRIAKFHREAETGEHISEFGEMKIIEKNILENFSQTVEFIGPILSKDKYDLIKKFSVTFLKDNGSLFKRRIDGGFIKDCHGDIHSEHVSVTKKINIIDCIEFNERFRFSDVASDLAFLSMDLDFLSRNDLSRELEEEYFNQTKDKDGKALTGFYKAYRAYVRGKVECFKLLETEVGAREKHRAKLEAMRHFHLAGQYAEGGFKPMLTVVSGLPGSGKSTVATLLHKENNANILNSDVVRKEIHNIDPYSDEKAAF